APNFVAEIRSKEGILIDPRNQTVTVYRVDGNDIVWNVRRDPRTFTSRILNGFVLNLQGGKKLILLYPRLKIFILWILSNASSDLYQNENGTYQSI
ncbi:11188_t:CDS:2, partial [Funneliformis mosseae]